MRSRSGSDGLAVEAAAVMLTEQRRLNRETQSHWDSMTAHRKRVTREVMRLAPKERVCIFGAGNCNDLDLALLRATFGEIHLVDVDGEALELGVERQRLSKDQGILAHPGVDVAGLSELGTARGSGTDAAHVANVLRTCRDRFDVKTGVPRCDAVVSCCILSQLIGTLVKLIGANHPRLMDLALVLRDAHLDLLCEHTVDGGSLLFISDMVSSDTAPALLDCPDVALAKLRDELISRHNYFHGTNPHLIERLLSSHPHAARVERRPPWRWWIGERAFLVTAIRVDSRGKAARSG